MPHSYFLSLFLRVLLFHLIFFFSPLYSHFSQHQQPLSFIHTQTYSAVWSSSMEEEGKSKQLLIKLKIHPKLERVVEQHDDDDDDDLEEGEIREEADIGSKDLKTSLTIDPNPNKDKIRVCPECNKEFSSGKALGGHMRIHSQQQTNPHKKNHHHHHQKKKLKPVQIIRFNKKTQNHKFKEKSEEQQPYYVSRCMDENGQTVCHLCGKNFPSIKSLFGHMRCHPEREYRGIVPPDHDQSSLDFHNNSNSNCKSSSFSSLLSTDDMPQIRNGDDCVDDDLVIDLPKWTVRAKRGRKVEKLPVEEEEEEEVELLDAVEDLLRLANGHDQSFDESGLTHKQQRVDEFEVTNSNSLTNKDDSGLEKRNLDEEREGKSVIQMSEKDGEYKNWSDNQLSDRNELLRIMNSNSDRTIPYKKRRMKKMKLMMDLESGLDVGPTTPPRPAASQAHQKLIVGATTPDKYKCSTCNKSFPTHQALGGHMSSHNKLKITILNTVGVDKEDGNEDNGSNDDNVKLDQSAKESVVGSSGSTSSTHQCTICNKVFPTGQALGGHKRCHWTGPTAADQAEPPSSQMTSSPGEASQTAAAESKRVLEFDLNEPPPMEDDGGYNGNGYASSS